MTEIDARRTYIEAARAHGAATNAGDSDSANLAHDLLIQALEKLRRCPDRGRDILLGLLVDEDLHVRCWAATHLLPIAEEEAVRALSELSSRSGIAAFN